MLRALVCFCNSAKGKSQSRIQSCHYEQEKPKVCVLGGGYRRLNCRRSIRQMLRKADRAGHTQDCSTMALWKLSASPHSAAATPSQCPGIWGSHTSHYGKSLAAMCCQGGAGNGHLQSLITHNARLRMGVRGPQSTAVRVILCPFELEVYLKPRGLSACPRAGQSWSSLTAFIGPALYGSLTSEVKKVDFCSSVVFFLFVYFVLFFQSVYSHGFKITI